jgi:hypothetical protein
VLGPLESRTSFIRRTADQTKVEHEPKQTSLDNDKGTTMRPVVAKKIPKKQNTTEDKIADTKEVNSCKSQQIWKPSTTQKECCKSQQI